MRPPVAESTDPTRTGSEIDSRARALLAAQAALDKQGEDIVILDLRNLSTVADFFILCTAGSAPQMAALRDHIEGTLSRYGCRVWHSEGSVRAGPPSRTFHHDPQWILMDCGEIVVHILDQSTRAFYRLEDLWADAPRIPLAASPRPAG